MDEQRSDGSRDTKSDIGSWVAIAVLFLVGLASAVAAIALPSGRFGPVVFITITLLNWLTVAYLIWRQQEMAKLR